MKGLKTVPFGSPAIRTNIMKQLTPGKVILTVIILLILVSAGTGLYVYLKYNKRRIISEIIERQKPQIEELVGLKFKDPIEFEVLSEKEFRERTTEATPSPTSRQLLDITNHFFSGSREYSEVMEGIVHLKGGEYDCDTGKIILPDKIGTDTYERKLAHEMAHMLVDQNFPDYMHRTATIDGNVAKDVISEGFAVYVEARVGAHKHHKSAKSTREYVELALGKQDGNTHLLYSLGASFIDTFVEKRGWSRVGDLFEPDIPCTSEQILHPEKFFEKKDFPVEIHFSDELTDMLKDYDVLADNTTGELFVQSLLVNKCGKKLAEKAAEGWDGDKIYLVRNKKTSVESVIFCITWDSVDDAKEFFEAFDLVLHNIPLAYYDLENIGTDKEKIYKWPDNGMVYFGRKGKDLLFAGPFEAGLFEKVVKEAWRAEKKPTGIDE
jgi:hypothetical protein